MTRGSLKLRLALLVGILGLAQAIAVLFFAYVTFERELESHRGALLRDKAQQARHLLDEMHNETEVRDNAFRLVDLVTGRADLHMAVAGPGQRLAYVAFSPEAAESLERLRADTWQTNIIDSIAGHGNDVAFMLQPLHQRQLVGSVAQRTTQVHQHHMRAAGSKTHGPPRRQHEHDRPHNGQAQPCAASVTTPRVVRSVEAVEDTLQVFRLDWHAPIDHFERHMLLVAPDGDAHSRCRCSVANRIAQQVCHAALYKTPVTKSALTRCKVIRNCSERW